MLLLYEYASGDPAVSGLGPALRGSASAGSASNGVSDTPAAAGAAHAGPKSVAAFGYACPNHLPGPGDHPGLFPPSTADRADPHASSHCPTAALYACTFAVVSSPFPMIALTFALPSESLSLREHFRHTGETVHPHTVLGSVGLHECVLIHTGIGSGSTRERLAPVLNDPALRPAVLISSGYAGALSPELPAGVLFLAENFSTPEALQTARDLLGLRQIAFRTGRLFSSSQVLETPEEKQAMGKRTACDAIDMETEAIAALCAEHKIPMLSLRAISDNAIDPIPVPFDVCINLSTGRPRVAAILWHLLGHPWRIPGFLQFARRATRSRDQLGEAIAALLPLLQPL